MSSANKEKILKEIDAFASTNFKNYFIVLFGSFAVDKQTNKSDIDIICFSKSFNDNSLINFKSFFFDLCNKYNISTTAQIPHHRFLIISYENLTKAIKGHGFTKTKDLKLIIPDRKHTTQFYSSDKMRLRFAFNAITTLNECISGNLDDFKKFKNEALTHLIAYIFILNDKTKLSIDQLVEATIKDNKTSRTEGMFLGYKNYPEMKQYLHKEYQTLLKMLLNQNFVSFDSVHYKPSNIWLNRIFNDHDEFKNYNY